MTARSCSTSTSPLARRGTPGPCWPRDVRGGWPSTPSTARSCPVWPASRRPTAPPNPAARLRAEHGCRSASRTSPTSPRTGPPCRRSSPPWASTPSSNREPPPGRQRRQRPAAPGEPRDVGGGRRLPGTHPLLGHLFAAPFHGGRPADGGRRGAGPAPYTARYERADYLPQDLALIGTQDNEDLADGDAGFAARWNASTRTRGCGSRRWATTWPRSGRSRPGCPSGGATAAATGRTAWAPARRGGRAPPGAGRAARGEGLAALVARPTTRYRPHRAQLDAWLGGRALRLRAHLDLVARNGHPQGDQVGDQLDWKRHRVHGAPPHGRRRGRTYGVRLAGSSPMDGPTRRCTPPRLGARVEVEAQTGEPARIRRAPPRSGRLTGCASAGHVPKVSGTAMHGPRVAADAGPGEEGGDITGRRRRMTGRPVRGADHREVASRSPLVRAETGADAAAAPRDGREPRRRRPCRAGTAYAASRSR